MNKKIMYKLKLQPANEVVSNLLAPTVSARVVLLGGLLTLAMLSLTAPAQAQITGTDHPCYGDGKVRVISDDQNVPVGTNGNFSCIIDSTPNTPPTVGDTITAHFVIRPDDANTTLSTTAALYSCSTTMPGQFYLPVGCVRLDPDNDSAGATVPRVDSNTPDFSLSHTLVAADVARADGNSSYIALAVTQNNRFFPDAARRAFTYWVIDSTVQWVVLSDPAVTNNAPTFGGNTLDPLTLTLEQNPTGTRVATGFADPDGHAPNYMATSNNDEVARVRVHRLTGIVEVTAVSAGRVTISITATDSEGTAPEAEGTQTFSVTVREAPPPTSGEVTDTALPEIANAISAGIARDIGARVSGVRSGDSNSAQFQLNGQRDWASIIKSQATAEMNGNRNLKKLFGNSSFALPFSHDNPELGFGGSWGKGSYQTLSGDRKGLKWDGSLLGFSLGADRVLQNGNLFGVAFNRHSGDFDLTRNGETSNYELGISTVSPYLGGQFHGMDYHASLQFGSGDGEVTKSGRETLKHNLSSRGFSLGVNGLVSQTQNGAQRFKSDLVYSGISVDGESGKSSTSSSRLRALFEHQHRHTHSLVSSGEAGLRVGTGSSARGASAEIGGGLEYARGSLKVNAKLRTLLFHSDGVGEFGLQVQIQVTPGQDGQGLSLQLTPSYGESESGLSDLWEHGVSKAFATNRADYALRINARLGFGLRFAIAGLVTPYATARYGDTSQFGFGINWKPKLRDLELDLLGEQLDTQQRVLLKGSLGF